MLTLLRKIRRSLIESQSAQKYFLYASGEILLVIIGILIALWINNRNQDRVNTASAFLHLQLLGENLADDIAGLEYLMAEADTTIAYTQRLVDQWKTIRTISDQTPKYLFYTIFERSFHPSKSGLETLNNSGEMAYLPRQIQLDILDYYSLVDRVYESEEITNNYIKIHLEPKLLSDYNKLVRITNIPIVHEIYQDDPRKKPDLLGYQLLSDSNLEMMISARYFQTKRTRGYYQMAIEKAKELKTNIDTYED